MSAETNAAAGQLTDAIESLWVEAAQTFRDRIDVIEAHVTNALMGHVDDSVKLGARSAAHKLAGTLGMFGMAAGSAAALDLEQLLETVSDPDSNQLERMAEIANDLRAAVEERSAATDQRATTLTASAGSRIRLVGRDRSFMESVRWAGRQRGLAVEHVATLDDAASEPVDAVIIDAGSFDEPEETIAISARAGVPIVVVADTSLFARRNLYLRAGAVAVVAETAGAAMFIELIEELTANETRGLSVVALGVAKRDLARMHDGFATEGCFVQPLDSPDELGAIVDAAAPDVIIVGNDLDELDIVDALKVIAADSVWSSSLVVALAPTWEAAATLAPRALAAGASDVLAFTQGWAEVARRLRLRAHRSMQGGRSRFGASGDRARLATRLSSLCSDALATGGAMSVVYFRALDLHEHNTTGGYSAGDLLLRRTERFLHTFFRVGDVVGAWAGGGFVVGLAVDRELAVRRLSAAVDEMAQAGLVCSGAVASSPDDGTEIDVLIAIAERRSSAGLPKKGQTVEPERRIVVVEDDEVVSSLVRQLLETAGYTVEVVPDGPSAVRILTEPDVAEAVSLVLLDITLPGLDGFGVLRAMKRANTLERLPVVMLTARSLEEEVQAAMDLGAVDHVAKPFSPQVLLRRVERALALVQR